MPFQTSAEFRAQHISTFYGINPKSLDVEMVTLTRGMVLTRFRGDKYPTPYKIRHGRSPKGQVARVFGLTDIICVDVRIEQVDEPAELTQLRALADERKATHNA